MDKVLLIENCLGLIAIGRGYINSGYATTGISSVSSNKLQVINEELDECLRKVYAGKASRDLQKKIQTIVDTVTEFKGDL